jgi:hypothetical protein
MQTTANILLVRPANFNFNNETEASNAFQNKLKENDDSIKEKVIAEFDKSVEKLRANNINVFVFEDTDSPKKPDAVFPNNWISLHSDGTMILYPMYAANRRLERRDEIVEELSENFKITRIVDLTQYENRNKYFEGTGSIVFDHQNKIAYACLSPRTDKEVLIEVCNTLNYKPVSFSALDENGKEIYHTNVMMCVGEKFAVICLDSIIDPEEKAFVKNSFINTGHQIIDITIEQMKNFAGNMLQIKTNKQENVLVLSQSAFNCLTSLQKTEINKYCQLVPLNIKTIETIGGGSARCMIAEIFLPSLN